LEKLTLGSDATPRIADDLRFGYVVIVPSASERIAGMPAVGWWRVRPDAGETLGRMQSGEGRGMTQKALDSLKYAPSIDSAGASVYCTQANRTDGFCNPCPIAFAGLFGTAIGLYEWATAEAGGWGLGQVAGTVGLGVYGAWRKGVSCGQKALDWAKSQ
jgi:hypothetical protein